MIEMLRRTLLGATTLVCVLGTALLTNTLFAEGLRQEVGNKGRIDWNKGMLYATGLGAVSTKEKNDAKAYLRARSFARMDARRNLLGIISHVKIDSRTTGQDYEATSDVIREEVSGLIKGSEIIAERKIRVGNSAMIEVTMAMPLYGEEGLASVFVPEMVHRNRTKPAPQPREDDEDEAPVQAPARPRGDDDEDDVRDVLPRQKPEEEAAPEVIPSRSALPSPRPAIGGYTGVIIDVRGLRVERCMSPKIVRTDGSEVWGTLRVEAEYVIAHGIVGYAQSMGEARKNQRAGSNPLVLRAVAGKGTPYPTDAAISEADVDRLLRANRSGGILDNFKVLFLVDAGK